jgi:hypothetical protein
MPVELVFGIRLKWRPLADRRKDARLVMLYKIDRELVAINKENRLIPQGRKTRRDTILALKASGVSNSTMSGATCSRFQSRTVLGKNDIQCT